MNPMTMSACVAGVILVSLVTDVPAGAQTANKGTTTGNANTVAADHESCELAAAKWKEKDKFMEWCKAEGSEIPVTQVGTSGQAPSSQPQPVYPNGPPPGVQP